VSEENEKPENDTKHTCGYEEDSFACKIRHIQINTGVAKANKDDGNRWDRARDLHQDKFNQGI
jgi:hypothetical protein